MRFAIHVLFFLLLAADADAQLVHFNSAWKYYDLAMAPPNQSGVTWKQPAYDDQSWASGNAELGYGDADETTLISSSTLTAYFRHSFNVDDPNDFDSLQLHLLYDDGAVIYINGTEVWRRNMPSGTINYNTYASSSSGDNAIAMNEVANNLISGVNMIAVEVHQHSASSSDISFDFSMNGTPADGVSVITRGPYLQRATSSSLIVRWRTNIPTESIIDYGSSLNSLNLSVSDFVLKTEHAHVISGLAPASTYFYQIRNTTDTLVFPAADVYFKTYPLSGAEHSLTAWILGDCGTADNNARKVRNAYNNYIGTSHTDMMLFLGDNAYLDGTDTEYQTAIFQNMYEQKLKNTVAWSCIGNHDGHSADSDTQTGPYYDIFSFPVNGECGGEASGTEAYYSFDYGNIHFIILDSYDSNRSVTGPMHVWCEEDLITTTADWIVVFWHHPAYSKGSHDSDTDTRMKEMRTNFLPLLESYGVDLVLSGHSHSYERSFLINDHYGLSSTFNSQNHTVGIFGDDSGQLEDGTPYYKAPVGPEGGDGAVYVVTGSSGKFSTGPLNHPAMFYDAAVLGSCVLKINEDTLSLIFLRQTGAIDDEFTLIKDRDCAPGNVCNDGNPCTINDAFDNNCYCKGIENLRNVSNSLSAGTGSLRDAIEFACDGDTIRFTSAVNDTIRLDDQIVVNKNLVIIAQPADSIVMSGQLMTRIFHLTSGDQLVLSGMTFYGGNEITDGGALLNDGVLMLDNTKFVNNREGAIQKSWTNRNQVLVRNGATYLKIQD
ncbi:MAG: metallophosphoesterase family protein [Saprospiraceae bacterium]